MGLPEPTLHSTKHEAQAPLCWPPIKAVLRPGRHGSVREHLKYTLRKMWASTWRNAYLAQVSAQPAWRKLFSVEPGLFHPPLSSFLDRRFSVSKRFAVSLTDLTQATECFGTGRVLHLADKALEDLSTPAPGIRICLSLNDVNLQEGTWALSLRDAAGQRLYSVSFGFLPDATLLIASVQGSSAPGEAGLEWARQLTKQAHGLRPPHLLLEAIRAACACWQIQHLQGIDPVHHIKGRWNQRRSRLKFDYRGLWSELGGVQQANGYWQLPLVAERRSTEDTPSRKRSMYRKRFEMLDKMAADFELALALSAPTAPCPAHSVG